MSVLSEMSHGALGRDKRDVMLWEAGGCPGPARTRAQGVLGTGKGRMSLLLSLPHLLLGLPSIGSKQRPAGQGDCKGTGAKSQPQCGRAEGVGEWSLEPRDWAGGTSTTGGFAAWMFC